MKRTIGIAEDHLIDKFKTPQSYSDKWIKALDEAGVGYRLINPLSPSALDEILRCDGFMWRAPPDFREIRVAGLLIPALENIAGIPCFYNTAMVRSFENKNAQLYELRAAKLPTPATWLFWDEDEARSFCDSAEYPLVIKLSSGFQSSNVRLIKNKTEARYYLDLLFKQGTTAIGYDPCSKSRKMLRNVRTGLQSALGHFTADSEWHQTYIYLQEFLPGNTFDYRITVVGNRAYGFMRQNRAGDFRASGSGLLSHDTLNIPEDVVKLAFQVAEHLGTPFLGVDIMSSASGFAVIEYNCAVAASVLAKTQGHWSKGSDDSLQWNSDKPDIERQILTDYLARL